MITENNLVIALDGYMLWSILSLDAFDANGNITPQAITPVKIPDGLFRFPPDPVINNSGNFFTFGQRATDNSGFYCFGILTFVQDPADPNKTIAFLYRSWNF